MSRGFCSASLLLLVLFSYCTLHAQPYRQIDLLSSCFDGDSVETAQMKSLRIKTVEERTKYPGKTEVLSELSKFDTAGRLVYRQFDSIQITTIHYDSLGRPVSQTRWNKIEGGINTTWVKYDQRGLLVEVLDQDVDSSTRKETYTYDSLGRMISAFTYDNGTLSRQQTFQYSAKGDSVYEHLNKSGTETLWLSQLDTAGRLLALWKIQAGKKPLLRERNSYTATGDLLTADEYSGDEPLSTKWTYSPSGHPTSHLVKQDNKVLQQESYRYDSHDRMIEYKDSEGLRRYSYDEKGLQTTSAKENNAGKLIQEWRYRYTYY